MSDYIIEPLDTDPEDILQEFMEFVQGYFPEWNPSDGQLDYIIARFFALKTATTADMASRVMRAIYRYLGSSIHNIQPLPGAPALALVQFTIDDNLSHTIDAGTLVGLSDANGDNQIFTTLQDVIVLEGTSLVSGTVQALEQGTNGNGLTGRAQMVELNDWISDVQVVGVSSGGADPEGDDTYIQRLTDNFSLMAPRPILIEDFALISHNVAGVWRALAIDNFAPGAYETQTFGHNYTGGTFTLTVVGQTTAPIPWNATLAQIRAALEALPGLEPNDFLLSGGSLPSTVTITFQGKFAFTNVPQITAVTTALTGGSSFPIATPTSGSAYATGIEDSIGLSAIDVNGQPLPADVRQNLIDYLQSMRPQNFLVNFVDPAYHPVGVTYVARAMPNYDTADVKTQINAALTGYLDPAEWGKPSYPVAPENRWWYLKNMVRYLELTTTVENNPGVDFTESLTFSLDGGALSSADKSFTGNPFALVTVGLLNGTVNVAT